MPFANVLPAFGFVAAGCFVAAGSFTAAFFAVAGLAAFPAWLFAGALAFTLVRFAGDFTFTGCFASAAFLLAGFALVAAALAVAVFFAAAGFSALVLAPSPEALFAFFAVVPVAGRVFFASEGAALAALAFVFLPALGSSNAPSWRPSLISSTSGRGRSRGLTDSVRRGATSPVTRRPDFAASTGLPPADRPCSGASSRRMVFGAAFSRSRVTRSAALPAIIPTTRTPLGN
ncbi:MAG TPA: hypothetical protein VJ436_10095, partial [Anaerolineales bacterium]|nr:hypothetical protein [Anaerolineales bacterium]